MGLFYGAVVEGDCRLEENPTDQDRIGIDNGMMELIKAHAGEKLFIVPKSVVQAPPQARGRKQERRV